MTAIPAVAASSRRSGPEEDLSEGGIALSISGRVKSRPTVGRFCATLSPSPRRSRGSRQARVPVSSVPGGHGRRGGSELHGAPGDRGESYGGPCAVSPFPSAWIGAGGAKGS